MSDKDKNQDPIIEADAVHEEDTSVSKPKKKKRSKLLLLGGVAILGAAVYSFSSNGTPTTTTVVPPPALNTTAGGQVQQSSQEYTESLRTANDQNANQALDQGRTFIPTPEGSLTPLNSSVETLPTPAVEEEPVAESEAVVTRKRPVVPQLRQTNEPAQVQTTTAQPAQGQQQQQAEVNPYIDAISKQMGAVTPRYAPPQSVTESYALAEAAPQQPQQVSASDSQGVLESQQMLEPYSEEEQVSDYEIDLNQTQDNENVLEEDEREIEQVYIAAGDVVYGEVIATVNSDMPMPVIVEVTTGEYKGARLRGTFDTDNISGKIVVSFSQMTNGNITVPVSALAVDGFTADSSLRSGIERRYLQRFGSVFATTFIEGLAEGLAEPDTTVLTDSNGNNQVVREQRTTEEAAWNGVNDAISVINRDVMANTPKGPKIYLHSGYPVGILFVDDLRENPVEDKRTP